MARLRTPHSTTAVRFQRIDANNAGQSRQRQGHAHAVGHGPPDNPVPAPRVPPRALATHGGPPARLPPARGSRAGATARASPISRQTIALIRVTASSRHSTLCAGRTFSRAATTSLWRRARCAASTGVSFEPGVEASGGCERVTVVSHQRHFNRSAERRRRGQKQHQIGDAAQHQGITRVDGQAGRAPGSGRAGRSGWTARSANLAPESGRWRRRSPGWG